MNNEKKMAVRRSGKSFAFLTTLLLCLCMFAATAFAETTGKVYTADGSGARIRSGPGSSYDVIGSAASGTTVTITGESNGWYEVKVDGTTGYISSALITGEDSSAVSSSTQSNTSSNSDSTPSSAAIGTLSATVGSETYLVSERYSAEDIPAGFTETETTYQGETIKCVFSETLQMKLVYLKADSDDSREFYIYYPDTQSFLPFYQLSDGENYAVVTTPPADAAIPSGFAATTLPDDKTGLLTGYMNESELPGCYYVYCVDQSGNYSWFIYDAQYDSFARCMGMATTTVSEAPSVDEEEEASMNEAYNSLKDEYTANKNKMVKIVAGLVIACAILLIILVNVLIFGGRDAQGDVFDDDDDDDDEDEGLSRKEARQKKKASRKKKKDFWEDDDDEEDTPIWLNRRDKKQEEVEEAEEPTEETPVKEEEAKAKEAPKEEGELTLEDELRNAVSGILDEKAKQKAEEEATAGIEAALAAAVEAELKASQEAQWQAAQEAELKAQQEAALKAQQEAALKAQQEAELKAQQEAQLRALREAQMAEAEAATITRNGQVYDVPTDATIDLSSKIIQETLASTVQDVAPQTAPMIEDLDYAERAGVAAAFATQAEEAPMQPTQTTEDGFEFFDFDDGDDANN